MNDRKIFVVTSFRNYGNDEIYYGFDGGFLTFKKAKEYVVHEMEETIDNWDGAYEELEEGDDSVKLVLDGDGYLFSWTIDTIVDVEHPLSGRTYIVTEWCSNCDSEIEMRWNTDDRGYQAFCPVCGAPLMLCDECRHSDDFKDCDWSDGTCHRMKKEDKQNGDD